jgi:hypothetical protein
MSICSKLSIFCGIFGKLGMIRGSIIKIRQLARFTILLMLISILRRLFLQDDTYAHTDEQVTQIFPHQGGAPSMVYSFILQETNVGVSSPTETPQDIFSVQPQPPLFRVQMPAVLQGLRIYTDASLIPDQNLPAIRNAGIGVYLVSSGLHHNFNVHIKAFLLRVSSVFTAEATALAFAGIIVTRLQTEEATFLSSINNWSTTSTPAPPCPFLDGMLNSTHRPFAMQLKETITRSTRFQEILILQLTT